MLAQLKMAYRDSLIYSAGNLANKVVGFILLPLYTSYFDLAEFGVLGLIEPVVSLLLIVFSMGLNPAFIRWYSTTEEKEERGEIFFNVYLTLLLVNLFILVFAIIFSNQISTLLLDKSDYSLILKIAFMNVFFNQLNPVIFTAFRVERRPVQFSLVNFTQFTITLILNIFFLTYLNYGLLSIFISQLISSVIVFIYFIPQVIKHARFILRKDLIRQLLIFGIPLIPIGISNLVINMLNRYILEKYSTMETVGLFTFSYRLSNTLKILIIESLTLSLTPVLYSKLNDASDYRFVKKNYVYATFLVMLVYIFFASFGREIVYLVTQREAYYRSYLLLPFLGFVYIIHTLIYFDNLLLGYAKKTKQMALITLISALFSLLFNFILIPYLDDFGAAIALIFSASIILILTRSAAKKEFGKFYTNDKIFKLVVTGTGIVLINFLFFMELGIANFVIKFIICIAFPLILYIFKFYDPIEIETVIRIIRKIRSKFF
jgi:O-antigen/teichoic acid export membrane protein